MAALFIFFILAVLAANAGVMVAALRLVRKPTFVIVPEPPVMRDYRTLH